MKGKSTGALLMEFQCGHNKKKTPISAGLYHLTGGFVGDSLWFRVDYIHNISILEVY